MAEMTIRAASHIIGGSSKHEVKNMHVALGMHSWNNTKEENERRQAAELVLRYWDEHCAYQRSQRGKKK